MKISTPALLVFGLMNIGLVCLAQNKEIEITQMMVSDFNNKTSLLDMAQDKHGNLWMLHALDGLIRYDGENMRLFSPNLQDPNSLSSGRMEKLHIDKNGIIWIGTMESGIDRLDPVTEKFTHYRHNPNDPKSLRSDIVRAFAEDEEGFIWVGTHKGLDKLDPETGEFIHSFSHDPDMAVVNQLHIRTLYVDKSGVLWIGGGTPFKDDDFSPGGLFKYDQKSDEISPYLQSPEETSLISNTITAIFEDSRGVFWVGTAGDGLHTMDREKGTFVRHRYDPKNPNKLSRPALGDIIDFSVDFISFINEDNQGHIWIGTYEGGLNRYDPNSKNITYYGVEQIGSLSLWDFFKTKDGLIWISSWPITGQKVRLLKINTAPITLNYTELESLVRSMIEIDTNEIWICTYDGLLAMDSLGNIIQKELTSDKDFQKTVIKRLVKGLENNPWILTNQGAYFYNVSNKTVKAYRHTPNNKNSISNDSVHAILPIRDQYVLIGTEGGLDVLNLEDGSIKNYLPGKYISKLFQDSEGTIWVSTEEGVTNKFDLKSGHFKSYGLTGGVNSFFEDSHHTVWLSVRGSGLWYYKRDKDEFAPFIDDAGVLGSYYDITGITEDHVGNLWLKTSLGTVKLNLETGATYLVADEGKSSFNSSTVYTSSRGKVYFGEGTGFIEWDGSKQAQNVVHTNLPYIDKFYINNVLVNERQDETLTNSLSQIQDITLKYFQSSFAFEYGHVDFISLPVRHTIQFKLENYDNYWRTSKGENRAAYVKVPPGEYVFHIRASNPNGIWTSKRIQITILKPWYQTWWAYSSYAFLFISVIILFIRWRTKALQQEKMILEEKVAVRTAELNQSLENLKSTQSQLIQSEKMASLGELTAGIAHEIQNPLNFVNNFSEVNKELIKEIQDIRQKTQDQSSKTEEDDLLKDIAQNLEKINHHGKRADAIVKGMLQHSRTSGGQKELTDINALCDEYVRLSYHGLRARDKSFNAKFATDFDSTLTKLNIVSHDIGRVVLNLINNAFYAVNERANSQQQPTTNQAYEPTVTVSTKKLSDKIEIHVKDNGNGIPDSIKEKIFQPFFTTKPTGQGTGLGLSLSYDIVKAHGGEVTVNSKDGAGSEFIIKLPIS